VATNWTNNERQAPSCFDHIIDCPKYKLQVILFFGHALQECIAYVVSAQNVSPEKRTVQHHCDDDAKDVAKH
jgi:hypothetical protein